MRDIAAQAAVPFPPAAVFAFLSALGNHWRVADRFVEVVSHDLEGGVVRVRGPLGVRRTAVTKVERLEPPALLVGSARIGTSTAARVSWSIEGREGGSRVTLSARIESASGLDRLLLALGGRRWLERRFGSALARLAGQLGAESQPRASGRSLARPAGESGG